MNIFHAEWEKWLRRKWEWEKCTERKLHRKDRPKDGKSWGFCFLKLSIKKKNLIKETSKNVFRKYYVREYKPLLPKLNPLRSFLGSKQ